MTTPTQDEKHFAEAVKIPAGDYTGWVFWEGHGRQDGYFKSPNALYEYCTKEGVERPKWVWACYETRLGFDAEAIVADATEDHFEDAASNITLEDMNELQTFLDHWAAKQTIVSYWCDLKRAVILDES